MKYIVVGVVAFVLSVPALAEKATRLVRVPDAVLLLEATLVSAVRLVPV